MAVEDMFAKFGAEVEYQVDVPSMYDPAPEWETKIRIGISAVGGGTVGEAYEWNTWIWGVWSQGVLVLSAADLRSTGVAATHAAMAKTLCMFLSSDGSMISQGREVDGPDVYDDAGREFLESEHERLSLFAYEGTAYETHGE